MASTTSGRRRKLPSLKKRGGSTQQGKSALPLGGPSKQSKNFGGARDAEDAKAVKFLEEVAKTLTDRSAVYPAYSQESDQVAAIWNVLHPDRPLRGNEIPLIMRITKMVRGTARESKDSLLDGVGYTAREAVLRGME